MLHNVGARKLAPAFLLARKLAGKNVGLYAPHRILSIRSDMALGLLWLAGCVLVLLLGLFEHV